MKRLLLTSILCIAGATTAFACPSPLTGKDAAGNTQNFGVTLDGSANCYGNIAIVDGSNAANKATVTSGNALKVDGSAVTQPVNGTVTANQGSPPWSVSQSGNWTARVVGNAGGIFDFAGQNAAQPANSILIGGEFNTTPSTITTGNASPLQLDSAGNLLVNIKANSFGTLTVSGTVTANQGSPPWTVQGDSASGASNAGNPVKIGGAFNTSQPTVTTGQTVDAQATARGALIVATGVDTFTVAGTVTANQGTSPWVDNISQFGGTNISTGTGASGSGIPRVTVSNDSNILATQSGNWTTRIVGNAGGILDAAGQNASSPANELLTACQFNTAPSTVTSGNITPVQCNNAGALNVAIVSGGGSGGTASSFGAAFPATGTAIGVKNGSNMVNLVADGSGNLDVNCQTGCSGAADHTASGTISTLNATVAVSTVGTGNVTALVSSLSATITLTFEGTVEGSTWFTINAYPVAGGASFTTSSENGEWTIPAGGFNQVRLRVSSVSGGTATVNLNAGAGSTQPNVVVNPTAANLQMTATQGTSPWVDNISQFGGSNVVTGTGASGSGIPRVTVSNDSNVLATQSGTWNITNISGTVSLPTGAATSANQPTNAAQASTTSGQTGTLVQGAVTTNAPSYTTAQTDPLSLDTSGLLRMSLKDTPSNTNNFNVNIAAQGLTNLSDNITQFGGTNISTGTGVSGTGIPRVTVSNDSKVLIWDSTNTNTLKASGTNAATTDTALVVAPSPNPSDVCTSFKAISQTSSTDLITSTNKLHICAILIVSATAQSVALIEGTGTTCASTSTAIMGSTTVANGMALAANGGFTHTSDRPFLVTGTTADHLCLLQSSTGTVSGFISYVDHN